jgi:hypothetical protein
MVISKISAGDFRDFRGVQGRLRQPETFPNAQKPANCGPFSTSRAVWPNARTAWLGREGTHPSRSTIQGTDITSEFTAARHCVAVMCITSQEQAFGGGEQEQ